MRSYALVSKATCEITVVQVTTFDKLTKTILISLERGRGSLALGAITENASIVGNMQISKIVYST